MEAAKDAVFPSRVLKRQLDEAQRRLHDLEDEYVAIAREQEEPPGHRRRVSWRFVFRTRSAVHHV